MAKADFPITPGRLRVGGGADFLNALRAGIGGEVFFDGNCFVMPYKIKIDGSGKIGVTTLAGALTHELDLDVAFPNKTFPTNVWVHGAYIRKITDFSGGSVATCVGEGGDTGTDNELLTSTNIFTGAGAGIVQTTGAANFARHFEASFVPTFTITTSVGNVNTLTAGELDYFIRFMPAVPQLP